MSEEHYLPVAHEQRYELEDEQVITGGTDLELPVVQRYELEGLPFQFGNRTVQWANEIILEAWSAVLARKCLIDVETGKEVDTIDASSHVYHPTPEGTIRVYQAVNAEPGKLLEEPDRE